MLQNDTIHKEREMILCVLRAKPVVNSYACKVLHEKLMHRVWVIKCLCTFFYFIFPFIYLFIYLVIYFLDMSDGS